MTDRLRVLGVDPGEKRIGLAVGDLETRFAAPLGVIPAGAEAAGAIASEAMAHDASRIVVGRPLSLSGDAGPAVARQQELVRALKDATSLPIEEYDERLTTVIADSALRSSGVKGRDRKPLRDAVAASVMLQGYLDAQG